MAGALDANPDLKSLIDAFKTYWQTGSHPHFGKDAPLHRPPVITLSAVRHVHLRPIQTPEAPAWRRSFGHLPPERRPASNRWLAYCVTDRRNCCLLAYFDELAHEQAQKADVIHRLTTWAEWFFRQIGEFPLDASEQPGVFGDRWRVDEEKRE
jgi:hypothetical protein